MKLCRFVKPVPSVLTANTVPLPELPPIPLPGLPPYLVVPYRVLPDKIRLAEESPGKYNRFVNPVPLVLIENTKLTVVPYRVLLDKIIAPAGWPWLKLCRVIKFEPAVPTANAVPKGLAHAAKLCRSIEGVARQNQSGIRDGSINIG